MGNIIRVRGVDGRIRELDEDRGMVYGDFGKAEVRDLSSSDVHIPSAMANFVAGYGTNAGEAIADIVCPPLLVSKDNDYYHTWDKDDKYQDVSDDLVGEDGPINEIGPRKSKDTYACVPRGLCSFVAQGVVANADPRVDPRMAALSRIMNATCMRREKRVIAKLQDASVFSGYTSAVAANWNGGAGSDPIKDLSTGINKALKPITHVVMAEQVGWDFVLNPNVQKLFIYNGQMTLADAAAALSNKLGLPPIVIGKMRGKSLSDGTYGQLWGTSVTMLHIPPGSDVNPEDIPTSRTFRWNKTGVLGANGFRFREWYEPNRGQDGGQMLAVLSNDAEVVVAAATGYLLTGAHV